MNLEFMYSAFTLTVSIGWWLLILAPKWKWTDRVVHRVWMPFALGVWLVTLVILKPAVPEGAGMGTLQAVVLLTNGPDGTLLLWTLLMSWDLFAGAWLARDAQRRGIHHAWVMLCLLATFILGFVGSLLYLAIRAGLQRVVTLHEFDDRKIAVAIT